MNTKEVIILEYIKISPNREKILLTLFNKFLTSKQISLTIDFNISSVYKAVNQLKEHSLIYQVNAQNRRNKLYSLTSLGVKMVGLLLIQK